MLVIVPSDFTGSVFSALPANILTLPRVAKALDCLYEGCGIKCQPWGLYFDGGETLRHAYCALSAYISRTVRGRNFWSPPLLWHPSYNHIVVLGRKIQ